MQSPICWIFVVAGMMLFAREGSFRFFSTPLIVEGIVDRLHPDVNAIEPASRRFFIERMVFLMLRLDPIKKRRKR